jgi:hypothetical protein
MAQDSSDWMLPLGAGSLPAQGNKPRRGVNEGGDAHDRADGKFEEDFDLDEAAQDHQRL